MESGPDDERRERARIFALPSAAPRSPDTDDEDDGEVVRRDRGKQYWETGDADQMVVEGGGVTLDDASTEWLIRAGLIAVAVLVVAVMMMSSIPGN